MFNLSCAHFSPSRRDGTLDLMRAYSGSLKAVAVDRHTGKIVELGTTKPGTQDPATVVSMVWQILAVATAQQLLSDIQHRLADVQANLTAIREFLEAGESASLLESSRYASDILRTLDFGDLSDVERNAVINHLETLDYDCAVVIRKRLQMLQDSEPHPDGTSTTGWTAAIERRINLVSDSLTNSRRNSS
jgi:hypothetical protein